MLKVEAIKYSDARTDGVAENYGQSYRDSEGLVRVESCSYQSSGDFSDGSKRRISEDNGRTWGEWSPVVETGSAGSSVQMYGDHEAMRRTNIKGKWNPVHKHFVGTALERVWKNGHKEAYRLLWSVGDPSALAEHTILGVTLEDGTYMQQMVTYEEGEEFDPADPLKPEYFYKNDVFPSTSVFDKNGDLLLAVGVKMRKCCERAGKNVDELFPSRPDLLRGLMVIRCVWNGEKYEFHPSRPVVISDLQSSRGVDEPAITILKSGRILVVFRGSNWYSKGWDMRIEPGTPGFKWYTYSDDGGKTFVDPMPWHFDDGEVIYSAATISKFIRDERNDRLYWIGNITDHHVNANYPRWPLCIVEVDETYGTAKKESYTVIDTRREGESDKVQLSNFGILQDRETGVLEIRLTKFGQKEGEPQYNAESWVYKITLPE